MRKSYCQKLTQEIRRIIPGYACQVLELAVILSQSVKFTNEIWNRHEVVAIPLDVPGVLGH